MKSGLSVKQDKTKEVFAAMQALSSYRVMVGYPADDSAEQHKGDPPIGTNKRQPDPHDPHPLTNAVIGYIMEHGAPEVNIPARPHLLPGVADAKTRLLDLWEQAGQAALDGNRPRMMRVLNAIGITAQSSVRNKIRLGPFVPLAPRTVAARRARGRMGTLPLQDKGELRNAVTYIIRKLRLSALKTKR